MTPKTEVKILTHPWKVCLAYRLFKSVRFLLPPEERKYLMPKSIRFFYGQRLEKNGALFGVFKDGKIKGVVALVKCPDALTAQKKGVLTAPTLPACADGPIGVVQSLCVKKSECGQRLSCLLLKEVVSYAKEKGYAHLFAQMAVDNEASLKQFKKASFQEGESWTNGHKRCLLHCVPR